MCILQKKKNPLLVRCFLPAGCLLTCLQLISVCAWRRAFWALWVLAEFTETLGYFVSWWFVFPPLPYLFSCRSLPLSAPPPLFQLHGKLIKGLEI